MWASVGRSVVSNRLLRPSARPFRSVFVVLISDFKYLLPYRPTTTTTNTRTFSSPRVCLYYNRNREELAGDSISSLINIDWGKKENALYRNDGVEECRNAPHFPPPSASVLDVEFI